VAESERVERIASSGRNGRDEIVLSAALSRCLTNAAFGSITENQANDPRSIQLQFPISY
jgi:hypothetical protein